jgi:hypothetical protein
MSVVLTRELMAERRQLPILSLLLMILSGMIVSVLLFTIVIATN